MRKRMPREYYLILAARIFLGAVFLYASFDKILHPEAFAGIIANYRILPDALIHLAAVILPWLEFFLGLALVFGLWMPGAVCLSNLLLLIFIGALVFNLARGLNIHCGCFESTVANDDHLPVMWYAFRDGLFLVPSLYLFYRTCFKGPGFYRARTTS